MSVYKIGCGVFLGLVLFCAAPFILIFGFGFVAWFLAMLGVVDTGGSAPATYAAETYNPAEAARTARFHREAIARETAREAARRNSR